MTSPQLTSNRTEQGLHDWNGCKGVVGYRGGLRGLFLTTNLRCCCRHPFASVADKINLHMNWELRTFCTLWPPLCASLSALPVSYSQFFLGLRPLGMWEYWCWYCGCCLASELEPTHVLSLSLSRHIHISRVWMAYFRVAFLAEFWKFVFGLLEPTLLYACSRQYRKGNTPIEQQLFRAIEIEMFSDRCDKNEHDCARRILIVEGQIVDWKKYWSKIALWMIEFLVLSCISLIFE